MAEPSLEVVASAAWEEAVVYSEVVGESLAASEAATDYYEFVAAEVVMVSLSAT